jgi:hypothetical protein
VAGYLVVNGSAKIYSVYGNQFWLAPRLDGSLSSEFEQGANQTMEDVTAQFAYTASFPVTAGSHTVSQKIEQGGGDAYKYNGQSLTVIFFPAGQVPGG